MFEARNGPVVNNETFLLGQVHLQLTDFQIYFCYFITLRTNNFYADSSDRYMNVEILFHLHIFYRTQIVWCFPDMLSFTYKPVMTFGLV